MYQEKENVLGEVNFFEIRTYLLERLENRESKKKFSLSTVFTNDNIQQYSCVPYKSKLIFKQVI